MAPPVLVVIDYDSTTEITVHATLTEKHTAKVELTKYPVESGVSPTDHSRELPESLTVEGVITNTPADGYGQDLAGIDKPASNRPPYVQGPGSPGASGFVQEVLDQLRTLKSARRAVKVKGPLRVYTDVVMTSLEYSRDSKLGDALKFSATFEQVRFVTTQAARLKATPSTKVPDKAAGKKDDHGTKPGTEAPPPKKSIAAGGVDGLLRLIRGP